jgi:GAF domain
MVRSSVDVRFRHWSFLFVGILLTGLTWPLILELARIDAQRLGSAQSAQNVELLGLLALSVSAHPVPGYLAWLALIVLGTFILGRPHEGPRNFKLLWGLCEVTLPDAILAVERKREIAEREREAAVGIVDDFSALMALFTPMTDRKDPRLAARVLDEICKLGGRAATNKNGARVSVWLQEGDGDLRIRASYRVGHSTIERFRLKPGQGLAGQVFLSGQPRAIPDLAKTTSAEFAEDEHSSAKPTTAMALPLYADSRSEQLAGVLCFSLRGGAEDGFGAIDLASARPYVVLISLVLTILKQLGISLP